MTLGPAWQVSPKQRGSVHILGEAFRNQCISTLFCHGVWVCVCVRMCGYTIAVWSYTMAVWNYTMAVWSHTMAVWNHTMAVWSHTMAVWSYTSTSLTPWITLIRSPLLTSIVHL